MSDQASVPAAGVGRWSAAGNSVASGSPGLGSSTHKGKGSVVLQVEGGFPRQDSGPPVLTLTCSVFRMCSSSASH